MRKICLVICYSISPLLISLCPHSSPWSPLLSQIIKGPSVEASSCSMIKFSWSVVTEPPPSGFTPLWLIKSSSSAVLSLYLFPYWCFPLHITCGSQKHHLSKLDAAYLCRIPFSCIISTAHIVIKIKKESLASHTPLELLSVFYCQGSLSQDQVLDMGHYFKKMYFFYILLVGKWAVCMVSRMHMSYRCHKVIMLRQQHHGQDGLSKFYLTFGGIQPKVSLEVVQSPCIMI